MKTLLTIISLAVVLCFSVSCTNKELLAELEAYRAQEELEMQNKEVVKNFWEVWSNFDYDAMRESLDPDFGYFWPSNIAKPVPKEETLEVGMSIQNGFPVLKRCLEEMIAEGNKVAFRLISKATHQGNFNGIPPTGKEIKNSVIGIFTVRNGKIVEYREEKDHLGVMQQLGMELKAKTESAIKPPSLPAKK